MKPETLFRTVFFLFSGFLFGACASDSRTMIYQADFVGKVSQKSLDRIIWENNLGPEDNISNTPLLKGDLASYHLIQIKGKEQLHRHDLHDLAVFIQSGHGTMVMGRDQVKVRQGSVIFVPHGMTHQFINQGPTPAVAIVVFSPPFDGKDSVPVGRGD